MRSDPTPCSAVDAARQRTVEEGVSPARGTLYRPLGSAAPRPLRPSLTGSATPRGSAGLYCLVCQDGSLIWKVKGRSRHSSPVVPMAGCMSYGGMPIRRSANRCDEIPNSFIPRWANCGRLTAETGKLAWRQPAVKNSFMRCAVDPPRQELPAHLGEGRGSVPLTLTPGRGLKSAETLVAKSAATPAIVGTLRWYAARRRSNSHRKRPSCCGMIRPGKAAVTTAAIRSSIKTLCSGQRLCPRLLARI